MNFDYLNKIKGQIKLSSNRNTANILGGAYKSVYKGRGTDFDDLREYTYGDNVKDIDWKASTKTDTILIRRFVAEKKHNVLFIVDSGEKMSGFTQSGDTKSSVALEALGTLAYIVDSHGDDFAFIQSKESGYHYTFFKSGKRHLENIMRSYDLSATTNPRNPLRDIIKYVTNNIRRKMIVFLITDADGLSTIDDKMINEITARNDLLVINIEDAYITGNKASSFDVSSKKYISNFISRSSVLHNAEVSLRNKMYNEIDELFRRHGIAWITIDSEKDVVDKIIELLERHTHARTTRSN